MAMFGTIHGLIRFHQFGLRCSDIVYFCLRNKQLSEKNRFLIEMINTNSFGVQNYSHIKTKLNSKKKKYLSPEKLPYWAPIEEETPSPGNYLI